ncbi:MAG TPA: LysR family transcriptional regulator [Povalibacter sp.]|uniref:LysR family transcriptional regulator n=1 Tax=Povalibacter sp. TaxID=1962978 RepID=UPI002CFAA775|nr:LysR family transcriptional regulator [Povalibacter sp.]HMN44581.1 LysR family transcriptional regulator [Povalibacter sp.]
MDTELARTFLVVVATGSFVNAAERLHVTQSTVSARIQRLESTLGAELFVRNKAGTALTAAGRQFQRHASALTRIVEQARQEIGTVSNFGHTLTIGGRIGLWEDLLLRWLPAYARSAPDVSVRALIGFEEDLMQALIEGRAHIGVMYAPQARPGLTIETLLEDRLIMVSTQPEASGEPDRDYVYVDWGPEFLAHHSLAFPNFGGSTLNVNIGWLGLQHILAHGGAGYFPERLIREHELAGRLHRVASAPEFRLPAYLCFPAKVDSQPVSLALDLIRRVAAEEIGAA